MMMVILRRKRRRKLHKVSSAKQSKVKKMKGAAS
jgi:hypothetical protein